MKQFEKDDIIDVAFQTATDAELFASQPQQQAKTPEQAAQESEDALRALSEEVMKDPARCFCRRARRVRARRSRCGCGQISASGAARTAARSSRAC